MTATGQTERHYWHEYRIGFAGSLARGLQQTLVAVAVGHGIAFVLAIGAGLLVEENVLFDLTQSLGLPFEVHEAIEDAVNDVVLTSVILCMVLALLAVCVAFTAGAVRSRSVSQALVAAARDGASPRAVPSPWQVDRVIAPHYRGLRGFLLIAGATLLLCGLIMVGVGMFGDHPDAVVMASIPLVAGGGFIGVLLLLRTVLAARQDERRALIAAHWSSDDEHHAWEFARSRAEQVDESAPLETKRNQWVRRGRRLSGICGFLAVASGYTTVALLRLTRPGSTRYEAGDRVRFSDPVEAGIDLGFVVASIVMVAGLIGLLAGSLIEVKGYRRERAWLLERARQSDSGPPPLSLLSEYRAPSAAPFATVLGVVAGVMLPFTAGVIMLGSGLMHGASSGEHTIDRYGSALAPAVVVGAVLLLFIAVAAGWNSTTMRAMHATRNGLLARWPTLPEIERSSEGKITSSAAMLGPALSPEPGVDDRDDPAAAGQESSATG